jgi:hypothetical protein
VAFDPERGVLRAKADVTLRAGGPLSAVEFELHQGLEIREVTDAQGRTLVFERSRRMGSPRLLVRLAEPVGAGESLTLRFAYDGRPVFRGLDYIASRGVLLRDESRWYPAVDLAAFTQNEIRVTLPQGWQAVWSGMGSAAKDGTVRRAVSSRALVAFPAAGMECADSANPVATDTPRLHQISYCFRQDDAGTWKQVVPEAARLLQYFSERLGPYPHAGFHLVEGFPGQAGALGYSAPGFLVASEDALKISAAPSSAPEFLPHEIAHQWFPSEVTLTRQEDGWLAESLAEYLAWRYLLDTRPAEARAMVERAMRGALEPRPLRRIGLGLRLFGLEDWEVAYATLYERGMLVWRTLETVIGRQRVDAALREYYRRYAGRSASVADFRTICEEISGRKLAWFFDYFLEDTRIPEIELRRLPSRAPGEVLGEIIVRNVPPEFTVRVEMRIHTTEGPVDHSVATRGEVTPFSANVAGRVTGIKLDPDARILRRTNPPPPTNPPSE